MLENASLITIAQILLSATTPSAKTHVSDQEFVGKMQFVEHQDIRLPANVQEMLKVTLRLVA